MLWKKHFGFDTGKISVVLMKNARDNFFIEDCFTICICGKKSDRPIQKDKIVPDCINCSQRCPFEKLSQFLNSDQGHLLWKKHFGCDTGKIFVVPMKHASDNFFIEDCFTRCIFGEKSAMPINIKFCLTVLIIFKDDNVRI